MAQARGASLTTGHVINDSSLDALRQRLGLMPDLTERLLAQGRQALAALLLGSFTEHVQSESQGDVLVVCWPAAA